MKDLILERNRLNEQSLKLRSVSKDKNIPYAQSKEIQRAQDKAYKKFVFFKNMIKELEKSK